MIGRILYGVVFVIALPALLVAWSARMSALTHLPVLEAPAAGIALAIVGIAFMLAAMAALWRRGGGLPMNAFPPPRFVQHGPYWLVAHPIYVGFVLACAGVALAAGSPGGFWIVVPAVAAGCAALVLGHESPDLRRRFGAKRSRPLASLPIADDARPSWGDVVGVWLVVFLPWLVLYEAVGHLPVPGAIEAAISVERLWPVWPWTTFVYSSAYPFVVLAACAAPTRRALRAFTVGGLVATTFGLLCYLVLPIVSAPRPMDADAVGAWLLALERADGLAGRAAFPAFHVFWALLAARLYATRGRTAAIVAWAWAALIAVSCVTTGMHAIADLAAAAVLWVVTVNASRVWRALLDGAEWIANGWREWRLGPMRIINHGVFAGVAATVGVAIIGTLLGFGRAVEIAVVALASLVGAALWGQYWVGTKTLLRPFGYFGSVVGVGLALAILAAIGEDVRTLAAAVAVAAPWIQCIGRLRCLVQGCCHGAPVVERCGIRYVHPRSRVVFVSQLGGVPVHATPVYSMASNAVIGALVARLWCIGADASFIVGAYLLLAGLARFVEEAHRGERQTPIVGGLRLYQWFAIASAVIGAAIMCIGAPLAAPGATFGFGTIALALAVGAVHWFAMGVDFPEATRRFSRLV